MGGISNGVIKTKELIQLTNDYVLNTYARLPIVLVKGRGVQVWDSDGNEYLDFFPGWAVSGLGHCPDLVVNAIQKQANKMIHVSNNYYNELQGAFAKKIIDYSFPGKVFFCNSGAEAIEGLIKLSRAYGNPQKNEILTMEDSFHGRTLAALADQTYPAAVFAYFVVTTKLLSALPCRRCKTRGRCSGSSWAHFQK